MSAALSRTCPECKCEKVKRIFSINDTYEPYHCRRCVMRKCNHEWIDVTLRLSGNKSGSDSSKSVRIRLNRR